MDLLPPVNPDSRFRQIVGAYSEVVRTGIRFVGWSLMAFIAGCAAFLVAKVIWLFLTMALKAIGQA